MPARRPAVLVALLLGVALAFVAIRAADDDEPPNRIVPYQLVARLATEALGRGPSQEMWSDATAHFQERGCTADSVAEYARGVLTSDEYEELGYDSAERALTLYRAVLAREPDAGGLASVMQQFEQRRGWEPIVESVLASPELRDGLVPRICAADSPAYGPIGPAAPVELPIRAPGFTGDQAALQQALNVTPPGGTVALAQHSVVRLTSTLHVPRGVTLTTAEVPGAARYARMGRLVRSGQPGNPDDSALVDMGVGARIEGVWLDGGRAYLGGNVRGAVTVRATGDEPAVVDSKVSDPLGGSGIFIMGPHYGAQCARAEVRGNVVTSYSSGHTGSEWADGINVACADAEIVDNTVVDATDVGIILYRVPGGRQQSRVADNTVIAAGRSAFAALGADPLFGAGGQTFSFEGSEFTDNTLWTGDRTHFDIALAVGTRAWFGAGADKGTGASFTDNTTGDLTMRATEAVGVSGMLDATVRDNTLRTEPAAAGLCPDATVAASLADGWASGDIEGSITDTPLNGCIGQGH